MDADRDEVLPFNILLNGEGGVVCSKLLIPFNGSSLPREHAFFGFFY